MHSPLLANMRRLPRGRDLQSRATAAWLVGVPQTYLADHAQANERLQWAIDHYPVASRRRDMIRLGGDLRASAMAHNTVNLLSQGFLDAASRTSGSAIEEARSTNQPSVLCVALAWAAGFVSLSLGDSDKAKDYGEELVDLAYKHGLRPFHAAGLCVGAASRRSVARAEAGIDLLRSGLAEMQEARYLLFYPFFRAELAAALGAIGRIDESLSEIDKTLRFAVETDYRWFVPEILRVKGELLTSARPRRPGIDRGPVSPVDAAGECAAGALLGAVRGDQPCRASANSTPGRGGACGALPDIRPFQRGLLRVESKAGQGCVGSTGLIRTQSSRHSLRPASCW